MRKRPRKQQVKSPWPTPLPTSHLRKSQRQQDRTADAVPKSTQEGSAEHPHAVQGGGGVQQAQPQTGVAPVGVPRRTVKVTAFAHCLFLAFVFLHPRTPHPLFLLAERSSCDVIVNLAGLVHVE